MTNKHGKLKLSMSLHRTMLTRVFTILLRVLILPKGQSINYGLGASKELCKMHELFLKPPRQVPKFVSTPQEGSNLFTPPPQLDNEFLQ